MTVRSISVPNAPEITITYDDQHPDFRPEHLTDLLGLSYQLSQLMRTPEMQAWRQQLAIRNPGGTVLEFTPGSGAAFAGGRNITFDLVPPNRFYVGLYPGQTEPTIFRYTTLDLLLHEFARRARSR